MGDIELECDPLFETLGLIVADPLTLMLADTDGDIEPLIVTDPESEPLWVKLGEPETDPVPDTVWELDKDGEYDAL